MFEFLILSNIACVEAVDVISRIDAKDNMDNQIKVELIEVIREATPECSWDAND